MVTVAMSGTEYGTIEVEFAEVARAFDFVGDIKQYPEAHISFSIRIEDDYINQVKEERRAKKAEDEA